MTQVLIVCMSSFDEVLIGQIVTFCSIVNLSYIYLLNQMYPVICLLSESNKSWPYVYILTVNETSV